MDHAKPLSEEESLSTHSNNYQLTKYPVGSLREIWTISWPLMLGLISSHLMIFMDRFFLSQISLDTLTAGANASLAYYIFLVLPIAICAISEVMVGKLHGENQLSNVGKPVWQMIWFSIFLLPIFWSIAYWAPSFIFHGTGNESNETAYFQTLLAFASAFCCVVSLNGFFIGIGLVKLVALCTFLANVLNIVLGYIFILGWGPIPSLSTFGAGIATGISQVFQAALLLYFFLQKKNRSAYHTHDFGYHFKYLKQALNIGVSAGLAHFFEVLAHYLFFRILIMAGNHNISIVVLVQSFSILIAFLIEAQSKGVCTIVSNLLGAKCYKPIQSVLKAALKLQFLFFLILVSIMSIVPLSLVSLFISSQELVLLQDPSFQKTIFQAIVWMSLFFLFDGFSWILIGLLTAAGDTKFLLYVSMLINGTVYLFSAYFFIGVKKNGPEIAWMIIAFCSLLSFCMFLWRYRSGCWMQKELKSAALRDCAIIS